MEVITDFVVETSRRTSLPLGEFFLKPIAGNLTEILNNMNSHKKNNQKKRKKMNWKIGMKKEQTLREEVEELVMVSEKQHSIWTEERVTATMLYCVFTPFFF